MSETFSRVAWHRETEEKEGKETLQTLQIYLNKLFNPVLNGHKQNNATPFQC